MNRAKPLALALVAWVAQAADAAVGTSGGQALLEPVAARPAALGEAWSAVGSTTEALGYNPAGLAGVAGIEGSALVRRGFAGDTFASALAGGEFRGFGVGAAVAYLAAGPVDVIDPTGRISSVAAESDLVLTLGIARELPVVPVSAGVSAKIVRSSLLEEAAATDYAADLGLQFAVPGTGLRLGASVQNWGGHLRYDDEKLPVDNNTIPLAWRFGAAWTFALPVGGSTIGTLESLSDPGMRLAPPPHVLRVFGEGVLRRNEHAIGYGAGLEYGYAGYAFLRGGYRILAAGGAEREATWSVGLGVAFAGLRLDWSAELLEFTTMHRFGISFARAAE